MKVKDYARAAGVHPRTIYKRIKDGHIVAKADMDASGSFRDIDIAIYPIKEFVKVGRGRPKAQK